MRMKIYRLVLFIVWTRLCKQSGNSGKYRKSRVYKQCVYIYIYTRGGERQGWERRGRCIYRRGIAEQGRNYPRGKSARSGFKLQPGRWCLPPSIWILCFASSFPKARDTYALLQNFSGKLKNKGAYSALCRGKEDSWSMEQSAGTTGRKTRMLSVVYLLGFFNPFLPTATLIALIARGM